MSDVPRRCRITPAIPAPSRNLNRPSPAAASACLRTCRLSPPAPRPPSRDRHTVACRHDVPHSTPSLRLATAPTSRNAKHDRPPRVQQSSVWGGRPFGPIGTGRRSHQPGTPGMPKLIGKFTLAKPGTSPLPSVLLTKPLSDGEFAVKRRSLPAAAARAAAAPVLLTAGGSEVDEPKANERIAGAHTAESPSGAPSRVCESDTLPVAAPGSSRPRSLGRSPGQALVRPKRKPSERRTRKRPGCRRPRIQSVYR